MFAEHEVSKILWFSPRSHPSGETITTSSMDVCIGDGRKIIPRLTSALLLLLVEGG